MPSDALSYVCHELTVNNELNNISSWLNVNKLSLNVTKTKFMIFSTPQRKVFIPNFVIDGKSIDCVDSFNFLGVIIDKQLKWNHHIDNVANKISKTTGVIHRLKAFLPPNILIIIYNSLIASHLSYGILCWGFQNKRLFTLQKKAIRAITCSKFNAHTEPLFKYLKLLKLQDIYQLNILKFYYKFKNNELPKYFYDGFFIYAVHVHQHNTRHANKLNKLFVQRYQHEFCNSSLRYSTVKIVNEISENILEKILTHSCQGFSSYVKLSVLQSYSEICMIQNCYICSLSYNN